MKLYKHTLILSFAIVCILALFVNISNTSIRPIAGPYLVTAPYLPEKLSLAGEAVPMSDPEVYERMDRELVSNTYFHSQTIINFKRAQKYFGIIEGILKKEGVPDDFKYLCVIESNLSNVVSPSGAAGFWQFLSGTAKGYGLEVNNEIDDRYHLEKSTLAACKYLREAKGRFGTWTLAAASYNMGQSGLSNRISNQAEQTYYDLLLYEETQRYVFRILAVKSIFENPERYGFYILPQEKYTMPAFTTVSVNTKVNSWIDFAKEKNITYKDLKYLNPWIRDTSLRNKDGNTYEVKILRK